MDLVSFIEKSNRQFGLTRPIIKKIKDEEEKETILDTFPDPLFDDHEEKLLKERDEVRSGEVVIISKREKEE